jgi:hypothetical protein
MKLSDDHMKIVTSSWAEVQRQFEKLTRQISSTACNTSLTPHSRPHLPTDPLQLMYIMQLIRDIMIARVMMDVVVPLQEFHAAAEEKRKVNIEHHECSH